MNDRGRFRGCLLGLAVGDALGTTVEFKARGSFPPVADMVGGGPFRLLAGQWTDDTSMALCLAASLAETGRFDPADQAARYARWMDAGYMGSNGTCVDVGLTTRAALRAFQETGDPYSGPTSPNRAGNGCIMRLAPIPMFCFPDRELTLQLSGESSRTTHGAAECIDACRLLGDVLFRGLCGWPKDRVLTNGPKLELCSPRLREVADAGYASLPEEAIRGSGYVVDSLEAALWCFATTESYRDAVLRAANLGDDADTTAAVCGQIAGAYYGEAAIPRQWREKLARRDEIEMLADMLCDRRAV